MIESIFSRLSDPARPYADGVSTLGDIGRHARGIRDAFARLSDPPDTPVCLCIEDRSLLLAALLASLAGGPRFILPHAYDRRVLEEVREVLPFRRILTDAAPGLPAGVEAVSCETCRPEHGDLAPVRSPDEVFLTLFTGGSTGKPRSWSKTPRNLFGEAFFLARTYDRKELIPSGPLYKSMAVEGGKIRIVFDYAAGGRASRDGPPRAG